MSTDADDLIRLLIATLDALTVPVDDPAYADRIEDRTRTAKVVLRDGAAEGFAFAADDAQFIQDQLAAEVRRTMDRRERRAATAEAES